MILICTFFFCWPGVQPVAWLIILLCFLLILLLHCFRKETYILIDQRRTVFLPALHTRELFFFIAWHLIIALHIAHLLDCVRLNICIVKVKFCSILRLLKEIKSKKSRKINHLPNLKMCYGRHPPPQNLLLRFIFHLNVYF